MTSNSPQTTSEVSVNDEIAAISLDSIDLDNIDLDKIDINSPEYKEILDNYKEPEEGFERIGFARPLGGFFMELTYAIIGAIVIAVTFTQIMSVLYPYPDSKAYTSVGNILFSFIFFIMNIPTSFSLSRFIAEYRVKNPAKMIQYIRFYVWYQMLTGVLLVTVTSIYTLYILETGNLVYAKWLLLVYISREYPAMTGMFKATLQGLQQFNYVNKLNFWTDNIIKPACEVIFVLLGRYLLGSNPVIGEMMGISIGYAIGTYVCDFISMGIAGNYLRKVLKPLGYTLKDVMIPHVEKDVWKESLIFGLKLSPPELLNQGLQFFTFFWWYDMVPAYATLMTLNEFADSIANLVRRGGGIYIKPAMSEALNNDKKHLGRFYIAMSLKFSVMTMIAIGSLFYAFLPLIEDAMVITGGLENWVLATAFITPNIIESTTEQLSGISNDVILGGNHPTYYSISKIANTLLQLLWDVLLLFVFQWPQNASMDTLVWILALRDFPTKLFILIINYIYIQLRIVKIQYGKLLWQAIVAPIPSAAVILFVGLFWFNVVYPPLLGLVGIYVTAAITVLIIFVCLLWIFFPLYTFFGGWDEYSIKVFHEAVEISGPGKYVFRPIDKANQLLIKSPLHNRFPIPWKDANREAEELMRERFVKDRIVEMREKLNKDEK